MAIILRRWRPRVITAVALLLTVYYLFRDTTGFDLNYQQHQHTFAEDGHRHWQKHPDRYSVPSLTPLPAGKARAIPKVQTKQPAENAAVERERLRRKAAVRESFVHSWEGYKAHAWLRDEVSPLSGEWKDTFGGWAATLVDSLDTLWILGLKKDFELAVKACINIDFTTTESQTINVFETTIRYLGGFLAAYDISGGKYPDLLKKAVEVGELLMSSFDTPNRMPLTRWNFARYTDNLAQKAVGSTLLSEPASLSLEFTRLSQVTGDPKYFDAIQRISDALEDSQNATLLPGMWPVTVDLSIPDFTKDTFFSLGGMSDSAYEYLPKQYLVLNGLLEQPRTMYENFIEVAKKHLFFRVLNPENMRVSLSGDIRMTETTEEGKYEPVLLPRSQHLTCFTGGMVGLASRIFNRPEDLSLAEELTQGCIWAYNCSANGVAPEVFEIVPCDSDEDCEWSESKWHEALLQEWPNTDDDVDNEDSKRLPHSTSSNEYIKKIIETYSLPPGFVAIHDSRYILRPEAIESIFIMYRITGKQYYADAAWQMFENIESISRTSIAASALEDVTLPKARLKQTDSMESFWLAETLKYFYLCFEEFGVVSLDDWVLNTEAHPLKRGAKWRDGGIESVLVQE